jgi:hypothetical protein
MKTLLWLAGIVVVSLAGVWIWLRWVNAPLNELMFAPRASVEHQRQYIRDNYPYRLVRVAQTKKSDVFSGWAIAEAERRTIVLAAVWLVMVAVLTVFRFRNHTGGI